MNRDKVHRVNGGWDHAQWTSETARHESGKEDRAKVPRRYRRHGHVKYAILSKVRPYMDSEMRESEGLPSL